MTDTRDNTKYQVPASKKATIIYITDSGIGTGADLVIYADDEDGTTNAVTLYDPGAAAQDNIIFISAEVPASKYINFTANGVDSYNYTIVEEAA